MSRAKLPHPSRHHLTHEEQIVELYHDLVKRDRKAARSILVIVRHVALGAPAGVELLRAIALVIDFAARDGARVNRRRR